MKSDTYGSNVGGNDAELTNILNVCIYMFAVINAEQRIIIELDRISRGKGSAFRWAENYNFEPISRSCMDQIAYTSNLIESPDFDQKLDMVVNAAKHRLRSG